MSRPPAGAGPAEPACYELRVKGVLDSGWSAWFAGLPVSSDERGQTVLVGPVADQAALHGLLAKVRDLGLELLEVRRLDPDWPSIRSQRCGRFPLEPPACIPGNGQLRAAGSAGKPAPSIARWCMPGRTSSFRRCHLRWAPSGDGATPSPPYRAPKHMPDLSIGGGS
jgi:hypothetical protein